MRIDNDVIFRIRNIIRTCFRPYHFIATIGKKKRPLSDLRRGLRMPVAKYGERRADVCAYLCTSIVTTESS